MGVLFYDLAAVLKKIYFISALSSHINVRFTGAANISVISGHSSFLFGRFGF
jgi:hypothetical protein